MKTVTLAVGGDTTQFDVHQHQLCEASTFFKAAFNSPFKESSERSINLPDDDEDTVDLFVQWLYTEHCDILLPPFDLVGDYTMQSIRLLCFAEKYDIPRLRTYVLAKLLAHAHGKFGFSPAHTVIDYAYQNTCPGSSIRRLIVDWITFHATQTWYEDEHTQAWLLEVPEFTMDLLIRYSKFSELYGNKKLFMGSSLLDYTNAWEKETSSDESKP